MENFIELIKNISAKAGNIIEPESLYHYTNMDGLLGISHSGKIWASDIEYLNDEAEFNRPNKQFTSLIKKAVSRIDHADLHEALKDYFTRPGILKTHSVYAISFCQEPDSLNMWRGYGAHYGYNIGYAYSDLTETLAFSDNVFLAPCLYYENVKQLGRILQDIWYKVVEEMISRFSNKEKLESFYNEITKIILIICSTLKDIAFKDEKEWRLIILKESIDATIKFRKGNSMLIPYLDYPLEKDMPLWREITIGPTPNKGLAKNSISKMCKSKGNDCFISVSKTPLRQW